MATGTVSRLWRWPVKSMAGEEVRALRLGPRGAGGDRVHAVLHHHKGDWRPLTAREAPRLLAWRAAYPFNLDAGLDPASPPHAIVTEPSGARSWRWGDPRLLAALERDLDRTVRLERDTGGIPDVPGTVLLTVAGSLAGLSGELGTEVDARRFRPNLHLELDAAPWAELAWAGAEVELDGGVRLRVDHACERCAIPTRDPDTQEKWPRLLAHLAAEHGQDFGLLARVTAVGRVAVGEQVRIVTR
jgi:MOSC domain-containing protein